MTRLVILTGPRAGETVPLEGDGEFVIGREPSCNLAIEDGTISRRHAALRREGAGFSVRDLDSRNGIRVQGRKLPDSPLAHGDILHVGSVQLRFLSEGFAEAPPPDGPPAVVAPASASPGKGRRLDLPAIVLGAGILLALWILYGTLKKDGAPAIEVVVLAVDEERYYSLDAPIVLAGSPEPAGIVAVDAEPGQSAVVLEGLEEGRAGLAVRTEAGELLLKLQVTERPMRKRRTDITPEEALPAAEQSLLEGEAATVREALLLVAVRKFEEATELLETAGAGEAEWARAKSLLSDARRRLRAARATHESAFFLAVKQRNANRAQEEALLVLNLIDPADDSLGYQKWTERAEKLGVAPAQIPARLEKLRRTAR